MGSSCPFLPLTTTINRLIGECDGRIVVAVKAPVEIVAVLRGNGLGHRHCVELGHGAYQAMCRWVAGAGCHVICIVYVRLERRKIECRVGSNNGANVIAIQILANDLKVVQSAGIQPEYGRSVSGVSKARSVRAGLDTEILIVDLSTSAACAMCKDLEAVGIRAAGRS